MISQTNVLEIEKLSLFFMVKHKPAYALRSVSLNIQRGETAALVGESGCGKTMTALSCMGLQPPQSVISDGSVRLCGREILDCTEVQWQKIRGSEIAMIFQEPASALNPLVKAGDQIAEAGIVHGMDHKTAKKAALELMDKTGLPAPSRLYSCYPFQLSGGQQQRVMIAAALMNNPALLIADEPTSSLDVTIQAQIMELLRSLNRISMTAVLLITHDLGIVRYMCDKVFIMYAGTIVESGNVELVFSEPRHPYTKRLLESLPSAEKRGKKLKTIEGSVPSLENRPEYGCVFFERCRFHMDVCRSETPVETGTIFHSVCCHLYQSGGLR